MEADSKQIHVPKTLDVEAVERVLAGLWQQTPGGEQEEGEEAIMRARAADLMVFLTNEQTLEETHQTIRDLALAHPCRALVMLADRDGESRDIEMYVSAFSHGQRRSKKAELCCEEVTFVARGGFTSELPSAVIPLLVPDLPVFLWWRDLQRLDDQSFQPLAQVADRLVIDSVNLSRLDSDLVAIARLFDRQDNEAIAVSDVNWARLTSWRALLANFYDVTEYRSALAHLEHVRIEYVAPESSVEAVASQALLTAGWLASRLGWVIDPRSTKQDEELSFECRQNGRPIMLALKRVERPAITPGRLAQVELQTGETEGASFLVKRTDDGLHLETHATIGNRLCPGSTLPVRNRSTAQLLAREMEILVKDTTYEDALRLATRLVMEETGALGRSRTD